VIGGCVLKKSHHVDGTHFLKALKYCEIGQPEVLDVGQDFPEAESD
jgi:hypothetical protein